MRRRQVARRAENLGRSWHPFLRRGREGGQVLSRNSPTSNNIVSVGRVALAPPREKEEEGSSGGREGNAGRGGEMGRREKR